jgi:hypothetical protein
MGVGRAFVAGRVGFGFGGPRGMTRRVGEPCFLLRGGSWAREIGGVEWRGVRRNQLSGEQRKRSGEGKDEA